MRGIELVELAPQLMDVQTNGRVLRNVEIGATAEDLDGDYRLLRGAPRARARQQVLKQAMQLFRPAQYLARADLIRMNGKLIEVGHLEGGLESGWNPGR